MREVARPLIVVPTYNEADNIDELLERVWEQVPGIEILFVDDNSPDGTQQRIRGWQSRAPDRVHLITRPGRMGLGTAYVSGFRWALKRNYDAAIEMDADLSHEPANLPRMIELLGSHDVVIGSRYVEGGGTEGWALSRRMISRFGNIYSRAILGSSIRDLTGGFNGWTRRVLEGLSLDAVRSEGYAFQIELKYRAFRAGFSLVEMPIVFVERRLGQSKMSWQVAFEAMIRVWALRLRPRS